MSNALDTQKPRATDLLQRMAGGTLYREAAERGMSLSAFLEREDPSHEYRDGLDAFGRVMKAAGIVTRSNPSAGYWADKLEAFDRSAETRYLFPEWAMRQYRRASLGQDVSTRATYASDDTALNGILRPYADAAGARMRQIAPAVPLSALIANTRGIDSDAARAFRLTDSASESRLVRVAQGAELPRMKLEGAEEVVRLSKYGRLIEATYESIRRLPIDLIGRHIARVAIQAETDKVATVVDVLVNGDGNSNSAAASYNLTALDAAAAAGTLTLKGWLAFKMKLANPYMVTTALVQEAVALQLFLLNTGSANQPLANLPANVAGGFEPINTSLRDNVALGITSEAPTLKVVAFDARFAIERLFEVGGNVNEMVRWIERQAQGFAFSEVEGYAVADTDAAIVLDVNA